MSSSLNKLTTLMILGVAAGWVTDAAMANTGTSTASDTQQWRFEVFLDDKPIGFHNYRVMSQGDTRRVETQASFDVRFLFFNAFRYRHNNVENWDSNCLVNIDAFTDANGKIQSVRGQSGSDGFEVTTEDGQQVLPECVQSFAYWNPEFLKADVLLNSQTGEFEPVDVTAVGRESVTVDGLPIEAERYAVTVREKTIDVWYSTDDRRWLALQAPAKGNRVLRYTALSIPQVADQPQKETRNENG